MNNIIKSIFFLLICLFVTYIAFGQGGPGDPGGPGGDPDEGIPFDGGVGLLIGGSIMYGVKKLKDKYNNDDREEMI